MKSRFISAIVLLLVTSIPCSAGGRVRIAVMGLFHPKQLVVEVSPASPLMVESGNERLVAGVGGWQRIVLTYSAKDVTARTTGARIGGEKISFTSRERGDSEFWVSVPGRIRRRYCGRLDVVARGNELVAVVEMELETAVASVVAAELPGDVPLEAVKAQAVVSRSYLARGGRRHPYADFCDTTHCQFLRQPPAPESVAARATRATQGMVLAWKGKPFAAMFSASCGGHTHSLAEVGYSPVDYPYYAVECPYCRRSAEKWSSRLSESDAAALLPGDEQGRIKIGRKLGWNGVQSNTFTRKEASGVVDINGFGRGHGVGLCQRGAAGMARAGYDFRAILAHYFPNTTIATITMQ